MAKQEAQYPFLYNSLLSAIKPVLSINKCQVDVKTLSQVGLKLLNANNDEYRKLEKEVLAERNNFKQLANNFLND